MNNRVQQRMDRSICEAVADRDSFRRRKDEEVLYKHQAEARRLLPATERLLMAGEHKGRSLTRDEIANLRSARSDYRRTLGLTVDREMSEMPTVLEPREGERG